MIYYRTDGAPVATHSVTDLVRLGTRGVVHRVGFVLRFLPRIHAGRAAQELAPQPALSFQKVAYHQIPPSTEESFNVLEWRGPHDHRTRQDIPS